MLKLFILLALLAPVLALPSVNSTVYYDNLVTTLTDTGLTSFVKVLQAANTTQPGQGLLGALYSDGAFTLYAPTDSAWEQAGLTNPRATDDLLSLLAYHIATATINSTDVADPRQHTIALTALRTDTMRLPGDQTQVLVLEKAPNATDGGQHPILIRGDTWNATSVGDQLTYENLFIQPIDRVLTVPSPLLKTLSTQYLAQSAINGTTEFLKFADSLGQNRTLEDCDGCTFFVPIDIAFAAIQGAVVGLNETQKRNVLENHILNGTVAYSPRISLGSSFVTAAGQTLAFGGNDTGNCFTTGGVAARIVRADIPVANGVVHLIDNVLANTNSDEQRADEAVSMASDAATATLGGVTGTIGLANATSATTSAPVSTTTGAAAAQWDIKAAGNFALLSVFLGVTWF